MKREKVWKFNLWLGRCALVLAVFSLVANTIGYIQTQQIEWFDICLSIVIIIGSILNIRLAKRELHKKE
ncbi:MAG: hypothetical protein IKA96_05225 [Alistipes sp.]|nr:hypothetical protein [Alistipes sp.]MBR2332528.1 hypothetical protein [Alistipes sp.]MBR2399344.1 hypothetical protein [Alistipes sp.]MBR6661722.1 hypothetical protein [Alistipes sp.]MBR6671856.1 hypothetical protein [Alistipes sp.]